MNSQLYADEQAEFKKKYEDWSSKIKMSEESINKKKDNNTNNDLLYYVPIGIAVITIIYFVSRK